MMRADAAHSHVRRLQSFSMPAHNIIRLDEFGVEKVSTKQLVRRGKGKN